MTNTKQEKPNLYFKEGMLDENPSLAFWKAMEKAKENNLDSALVYAGKIRENIPYLTSKYLNQDIASFNIPLSKTMLADFSIKLIKLLGYQEGIGDLVLRAHKNIEISIALSKNWDDTLKNWIRKILSNDDYKIPMLEIIKKMEKKNQEEFLENLVEIAKNEVDQAQYISLEILNEFSDKKEVLELFLKFVDDWDKEVKIRAIEAVSKFNFKPEVRKALERAYDDERDESIKHLIMHALKEESK